MITRTAQLRMLIANEELRRREIAAASESMLDGETVTGLHAHGRLFAYRAELADILSPTASANETLAGSLVTKSRAQSETSLHV